MVFNFFLTQLSIFTEMKREGKGDWKEVKGGKETLLLFDLSFVLENSYLPYSLFSSSSLYFLCSFLIVSHPRQSLSQEHK